MKRETLIFAPGPDPLRVAILVMADTNALSLAASVDPMRAANRRAGRRLFDWHFVTPGGTPVPTTAGFEVTGAALSDRLDADVLMIVAGFRLSEQAAPALLSRLRRIAPRLSAMIGIDGGSWFLALAGLLDGQAATVRRIDADHIEVTMRDRIKRTGIDRDNASSRHLAFPRPICPS